ncbi:MAG: hypothetical protein ACREIF_09505 [Chthoniobacterales bacterium]
MKNTLLTLACVVLAPLGWAQTSTTTETTVQKPVVSQSETTTTTTTTSADGTVTTFAPNQTLVVRQAGMTNPVSYVLGKTVLYVDRTGKRIETTMIHPGVPVHVYYENIGSARTVTRVVVDQD